MGQTGNNGRNQMPMARVPKLEPVDRPPAVTAITGRASRPAKAADDRELVRWAQAEDKEAFEELIRRHQHRVFAVAGGILRRREDVEDIAQHFQEVSSREKLVMPQNLVDEFAELIKVIERRA